MAATVITMASPSDGPPRREMKTARESGQPSKTKEARPSVDLNHAAREDDAVFLRRTPTPTKRGAAAVKDGRSAPLGEMVQVAVPSGETIYIEPKEARYIYIKWLVKQPKETRVEEVRHLHEVAKVTTRDFISQTWKRIGGTS